MPKYNYNHFIAYMCIYREREREGDTDKRVGDFFLHELREVNNAAMQLTIRKCTREIRRRMQRETKPKCLLTIADEYSVHGAEAVRVITLGWFQVSGVTAGVRGRTLHAGYAVHCNKSTEFVSLFSCEQVSPIRREM